MSADSGIGYSPTVDWHRPQPPVHCKPPHRRPRRLGMIAGAGAAVAAATALVALYAGARHSTSAGYTFHTYNNSSDPAFNQLLGINNGGVIAGYYGSGAAGHPNKGYQLLPGGRGDYVNENFPGALQTQVTGLNDTGITVGFWSGGNSADMTSSNLGFYAVRGTQFHQVNFPTTNNAIPQVDQLLGVNDHGAAVGFYTNAQGRNRGYEYNIHTGKFSRVLVPGAPRGKMGPSLTATAINNHGDVAGFYTAAGGATDGFLMTSGGRFMKLAHPGASVTEAFGVNDGGEVVGTYSTGTGAMARMHGFTWRAGHGFITVDNRDGDGTTTINGVNDAGDLVGFYTDAKGNVDGMLALPRH